MKPGRSPASLGRAPVPEWEEVARAAWPGRLPHLLVSLAGRAQLVVFVVSIALLLVAAGLRLPWLGLLAWSLGAVTDWLATPADHPIARLLDLVGFRAQLRALARSLVAVALVFSASGDALVGLGYVIVILFVQLAWTTQPVLATWLSRSAPPLRYLPGAASQPVAFARHARAYARGAGTPGPLVLIEFVALAKALATGMGLMTAASDLAIAAALIVAALAYTGWTLLAARRLHSDQPGLGRELFTDLAASSPAFLVYVSLAARQSRYIANQWLPALDALPHSGFLMVREGSQLAPLTQTRHAVVYAPGPRDVERLTLPEVRVALYLAYGERNGQLLRDPSLKHVMLLHGDSDKATSANGMARAFDEVWVAGPAAVARYRAAGVDVPDERFVLIGRPQVASLPVGPGTHDLPVLLYAPTFEGYYDQTSHSSLDTMGVDLVRRLLAGTPRVRVWFRPHPASGVTRPSMLAAIAEIEALLGASDGGHVVATDSERSLPECLAEADVLISDISSVATDFLYTERPVITCDPAGLPADEFVATYPTQVGSYLLHPGLRELDDVLAAALGADPLRTVRVELKRHVLGDPPGGPQAAFAANIARITTA